MASFSHPSETGPKGGFCAKRCGLPHFIGLVFGEGWALQSQRHPLAPQQDIYGTRSAGEPGTGEAGDVI
ncbi:hypothetical protein SBV1_2740020 [Verrucomicrobia bacterium]|nr:hypothetical protein SBV1_2740020 [Verrucomicrobiota bacterium]